MNRPEYIEIKIDLLKMAKKLIKTKEESYICFAVSRAAYKHENPCAIRAGDQLEKYIQKALGINTFLSGWQRSNGFDDRVCKARIRQDRLAWIDWMIADYKKWGPE